MEDKINKILDAMSDDVYIKKDEFSILAFKDGYCQGYEDAVKKACEAFCRYCPIANNYTCPICERKNDFNKAMEE